VTRNKIVSQAGEESADQIEINRRWGVKMKTEENQQRRRGGRRAASVVVYQQIKQQA